jgi:hypothetical protein
VEQRGALLLLRVREPDQDATLCAVIERGWWSSAARSFFYE